MSLVFVLIFWIYLAINLLFYVIVWKNILILDFQNYTLNSPKGILIVKFTEEVRKK